MPKSFPKQSPIQPYDKIVLLKLKHHLIIRNKRHATKSKVILVIYLFISITADMNDNKNKLYGVKFFCSSCIDAQNTISMLPLIITNKQQFVTAYLTTSYINTIHTYIAHSTHTHTQVHHISYINIYLYVKCIPRLVH